MKVPEETLFTTEVLFSEERFDIHRNCDIICNYSKNVMKNTVTDINCTTVCEKNRLYLLGKLFEVFSYNRELADLLNNPESNLAVWKQMLEFHI